MMSPHVLDRLPFWVEGDLAPDDIAVVQGHLAQCPACREAAERLETSQRWLREALATPFDLQDTSQLRLQVMTQLRAGSRPILRLSLGRSMSRGMGRGPLGACAASLLIPTLVWRPGPRGGACAGLWQRAQLHTPLARARKSWHATLGGLRCD